MITTTAPVSHTSERRVLTGIARGLLVAIGAAGVAAVVYFGFFASAEEGGNLSPVGWLIGFWKLTVSVGMLTVALWPGLGRARRVHAGLWLAGADLAFGAVKFFGYGETESLVFTGASLCLFGLLVWLRTFSGADQT